MKTALIVCVYNRPQYLKRCLSSLKRCSFKDVKIIFVDDYSTDLLPELQGWLPNSEFIFKDQRRGICDSLIKGYDKAFKLGYEFVMNLDSDSLVRNDFFERMKELHNQFPNDIVSGFHSTTKNKNGTERHVEIEHGEDWISKVSIGGVNMGMNKKTYETYLRPTLEKCLLHGGNFDHQVCLKIGRAITVPESLVQHIGVESSMNHNQEEPDVADTFKMLSLKNVTLVCVDDDINRADIAVKNCTKNIFFGCAKVFTSSDMIGADLKFPEYKAIKIPRLNSKEAYSNFIIQELHKYIDTEFALIVQHDGYVKNPEAWSDEFLQYDYIGATWWFKDGMNVGNGGFSLRSKKLLELTAQLNWPVTHPEDNVICRVHRKELEQCGIKFAPESLAQHFSFEGYYQHGTWNGQFGFHGARAFRRPANPSMQGFIINQFLGLGDILFLVPLIRYWMGLGHDVIWPIADEYYSIARNFPDIQFVRKSDWPRVPYDSRIEVAHQWAYGRYIVKPLRWNLSRMLSEAMTTKYSMYGLDYKMWWRLSWERDIVRENELMNLVQATGDYELTCQEFGNVTDGGATHKAIESNGRKVYLSKLIGYNLLDWARVIENATIIHAVSSSTLYLFETLNLKAKEIHLYSRKAGMNDFEMVRPIMSKNYILHV